MATSVRRFVLTVVGPLCITLGTLEAQIALSKDTVRSVDVCGYDDTVSMLNASGDTLTIDSITVVRDIVQMRDCEVGVDLRPVNPALYCVHYAFSPSQSYLRSCRRIVLPPAYTVDWIGWLLWAYTPVLIEPAGMYTGDTLGALLTFHAGPYQDSVVLMGLGQVPKTATRWAARPETAVGAARGPGDEVVLDLRGKRLTCSRASMPSAVYVAGNAASRRLVVRYAKIAPRR